MTAGVESDNMSRDSGHAHFRGGLSFDNSLPVQNLTTLASAVPQISLRALKFKMGHVTLVYAGLNIAYLYTKFGCHSTRCRHSN